VIAQEPVGRRERLRRSLRLLSSCSDPAALVIGHAMVVDGGQTV